MSWQNFHPQWGVVLGSGLGGFSERMEVEARVPYAEIAGLPQSRVAGHAGEFVFGKISGVPIVAARGRVSAEGVRRKGGVAERSNASVLKTDGPQGPASSNLAPSANHA